MRGRDSDVLDAPPAHEHRVRGPVRLPQVNLERVMRGGEQTLRLGVESDAPKHEKNSIRIKSFTKKCTIFMVSDQNGPLNPFYLPAPSALLAGGLAHATIFHVQKKVTT